MANKSCTKEGAGLNSVVAKTGATRLVERGYSDFGADWSPSGTSIVFTHGIAGSPFAMTDGTSTIYVLRLLTGTTTRLVGHSIDGGTPSWSPDGRWIATAGQDGIYLIDARTGRAHQLFESDALLQIPVAWSHDGRRIGFADARGVYTVDRLHSNRRRVTGCECNGYSDSVSWSPDDHRLVFSQTNDKASDGLYVVDANGSNLHRIVQY
jgi:Tol biopolymer transport system component